MKHPMNSAKTRIKIILGLLLAAALLFGGLTVLLLHRNRQAQDKSDIAGQFVTEVFEAKILSDEYTFTGSERARAQWFTKQERTKEHISAEEHRFRSDREQELVTQLKESLADGEGLFRELITATEENGADGFRTANTNRVSSQLAVRTQEAIAAATALDRINSRSEQDSLQQIVMLFSAAGGLFVIILLGSVVEIWWAAGKLENQKAQDEAILRDIGDAVFAINADGEIILFNQAATEISGLSGRQVLGKKYDDILLFVDEQTKRPQHEFIEQALSGKKSRMYKHTALKSKSSGHYVPVADSAAPIFNPDGSVRGAVVVFRDITPERKLEEAKDEFFSVASHQLRTPLGSIRWNLELLLSQKLPGAAHAHLKDMHASTTRALSLVGELLSLVHIEQNRVQLNPADTDLAEVTQSVDKEMQPIARKHGVELRIEAGKNLPAHLDPKRFRAVIQNLVSNAIKYTPAKGKVTVTAENKKEHMLISVTDTGMGIPKAQQPKIFSKFFRADNALESNTEGTGLGLFIARAYAEAWGGRLWFSSKPGKTTFYVTVPHRTETSSKPKQEES